MAYHPGVLPRHALNHIRLLRYAGMFTYACVGVPLVNRDWMLSRLRELRQHEQFASLDQARNHTDLLLWDAVLPDLRPDVLDVDQQPRFTPLSTTVLKLLGLALMRGRRGGGGLGYSHSGLSAMLMVVASLVLPWLLPFWGSAFWLVRGISRWWRCFSPSRN